ncbi:MAG: ABC transporter ATP-binding protein [Anaerolineae bacterium]
MPVIQTDRLTKYYGKSRGVLDLSLSVEPGEVFGFLGPNGAGKTTTIRILLGLIRATRGSATVLGMDPFREAVALHRRVGYVSGELALYPRLTGEQTLRYFAGLRGGVDWDFVRDLARRLDFDLSRVVGTYSRGNKQKLGLIQALMNRPELLILDEPTAGLDPLMQQVFYDLVREGRAAGQTFFLSSHILPEVERICDRVGIIRQGRLVEVQTVAVLKQRALRRVTVEFDGPVPAEAFKGLPGVQDLRLENGRLHCTVIGSPDALIKALAAFTVRDLRSEQPGLEEVFLTFYGETSSNDV